MKNLQIDGMVLNLRFPSLNEKIRKISFKKKTNPNILKIITIGAIGLFIMAYSFTPSYSDEYEVERGIISR